MTRPRLIQILTNNSGLTTSELLVGLTEFSGKDLSVEDFNILLTCASGQIPNENPVIYHRNVNTANNILSSLSANMIDILKAKLNIVTVHDSNNKVIKIL